MENITALAVGTALAGVLAPFLTALLNQPAFKGSLRAMVATGVSLVLGVISTAVTGGFENPPALWAVPILAVVGVSQALYALVLDPLKITDPITALRTMPALDEAAKNAGEH